MDRHDAMLTHPAFIIARDHAARLLEEAERERLRRAAAGSSPIGRGRWRISLPDLRLDLRIPRGRSVHPRG